jgi:proteic killer suppression protein
MCFTAYRDAVYYKLIRTFSDKKTEAFRDERVLDFQSFARSAKRKLDMLHAAAELEDLKVPPSNRLEKLEGNLKGFHSIRINDQWRLIFRWIEGNAHGVQIHGRHSPSPFAVLWQFARVLAEPADELRSENSAPETATGASGKY